MPPIRTHRGRPPNQASLEPYSQQIFRPRERQSPPLPVSPVLRPLSPSLPDESAASLGRDASASDDGSSYTPSESCYSPTPSDEGSCAASESGNGSTAWEPSLLARGQSVSGSSIPEHVFGNDYSEAEEVTGVIMRPRTMIEHELAQRCMRPFESTETVDLIYQFGTTLRGHMPSLSRYDQQTFLLFCMAITQHLMTDHGIPLPSTTPAPQNDEFIVADDDPNAETTDRLLQSELDRLWRRPGQSRELVPDLVVPVQLAPEVGTHDKAWYTDLQKHFFSELLKLAHTHAISGDSCTKATKMLFRAYNKEGVERIGRMVNKMESGDYNALFAPLEAARAADQLPDPLLRATMEDFSIIELLEASKTGIAHIFGHFSSVRFYKNSIELARRPYSSNRAIVYATQDAEPGTDMRERVYHYCRSRAGLSEMSDKEKNGAYKRRMRIRAINDVFDVLGWTAALMMPSSAGYNLGEMSHAHLCLILNHFKKECHFVHQMLLGVGNLVASHLAKREPIAGVDVTRVKTFEEFIKRFEEKYDLSDDLPSTWGAAADSDLDTTTEQDGDSVA